MTEWLSSFDITETVSIGQELLACSRQAYKTKKRCNDSPSFTPKGYRFEKRINPSWSSKKPSLASEVLETPTLWGFVETILNRYKAFCLAATT
jgi:hypothetical protein